MAKAKKTRRKRFDREALREAFTYLSPTFTWAELVAVVGHLGSQSYLRHILFDEWGWVESTNATRKLEIRRKDKLVGGRPEIWYRKTAAGEAAATMMIGSGSL